MVSFFLGTISAFASNDGNTCRVYGTNGVVATVNPTTVEIDKMSGNKDVTVEITKKQLEDVGIVVELILDGVNIGSGVVTVPAGKTESSAIIFYKAQDKRGIATVNIASASCQ